MVGARDVAAQLGVSISTVGRAMADDPRISDETKARVKRAAEKLGYVGNTPARMMRGGSSNLIGLMIPDVGNDFYAAMAQTMSEVLNRQGFHLGLALTRDDRDVEARHIRDLVGARAAGVILVPTASPRRESRSLLANILHIQLLRRHAALGSSWFGIDDRIAFERATNHLIDLGHTRIAYIGALESLSTGAARVEGYRAALGAAGFDLDPQLERLGLPEPRFGAESLHALMALPFRPTAIITGSSHITAGVIETVEQLNLDIPKTLSLVAFGAASWFQWWRGGLTTISPPIHELATSCALWFLDQMGKRGAPSAPHTSLNSSTLVIRHSTSAPPRVGKAVPAEAPALRRRRAG